MSKNKTEQFGGLKFDEGSADFRTLFSGEVASGEGVEDEEKTPEQLAQEVRDAKGEEVGINGPAEAVGAAALGLSLIEKRLESPEMQKEDLGLAA